MKDIGKFGKIFSKITAIYSLIWIIAFIIVEIDLNFHVFDFLIDFSKPYAGEAYLFGHAILLMLLGLPIMVILFVITLILYLLKK